MKLIREPLVHFLVLGMGLFLLFGIVGESNDGPTDRIEVSAARVAQMKEIFTRTWQRPPTEKELEGLIEDHIREEIYYREALAMGLDRDDTIVRRRLRQKLEFVTDDIVDAIDPTEEQLAAYFNENADAFRVPARVSFRHIYFNQDRRGSQAMQNAESLLTRLNESDPGIDTAGLGDTLMLPGNYGLVSEDEIARGFGNEFAARLTDLPSGRWSGPVKSAFGLHLVFIKERVAGSLPALAEIRDVVDREWRNARREKTAEAFYSSLRERYIVGIEDLEEGAVASPDVAGVVP